jgi:hypothetical protein
VCLRELVDLRDPQAERIRVVMDNLSTRTSGSLDEAFSALEAHHILGGWSSTSPPNSR